MDNTNGKFIVIEGLEGAGKSTVMAYVRDFFLEHGKQVHELREPGGTKLGEIVRQLIKSHDSEESIDARAELLLFYAARVQLVERVIKPLISEGFIVLCDRFELSSMAYQGGGRGLSPEFVHILSQLCLNDFKPDLTLFLDVDLKVAFERVRARGDLDRIESECLTFFESTKQAYYREIEIYPNVIKIDANQSLQEVQNAIRDELLTYLNV